MLQNLGSQTPNLENFLLSCGFWRLWPSPGTLLVVFHAGSECFYCPLPEPKGKMWSQEAYITPKLVEHVVHKQRRGEEKKDREGVSYVM